MPNVTLSHGSAPQRTDTKWKQYVRWLLKLEETIGISERNKPKHSDTVRTLQQKVDRAYSDTIS